MQTRKIFYIERTELALQDLAFNLDEVTELQDSSVFRLKQGSFVPFSNAEDLVFGAWIQMNFDLTIIERDGYTILDVLSDVGGLQGILISAISVTLSIINHN